MIQENLLLQDHLFLIGTTGGSQDEAPTLLICGSSYEQIDRARLLTGTKFLGRIISATDTLPNKQWLASVVDLGASPYDEDVLWDVLRKAVRAGAAVDPRRPPEGSKGIEAMLQEARARLVRLAPEEAYAELVATRGGDEAPAFLVDIRPAEQREREGGIGGSLIVERNVLEWRFDPRSEARLGIVDRSDVIKAWPTFSVPQLSNPQLLSDHLSTKRDCAPPAALSMSFISNLTLSLNRSNITPN